MTWKLLTHDWRPPIQGGDPLCDGTTWPVVLPSVTVDETDNECAAGWNSVEDLAAGMRIAGLWQAGRPSRILLAEPTGTVVTRGDKTRSSGLTLVREATDAEIRSGIERLSEPFGGHAATMADSQIAWREALARPKCDAAAVEAGLRAALAARGLDWTPRRFETARDAWDAWDAWAAWDAQDALVVQYAALMGWTDHDPMLLTTGICDAYRAGLAVALPTGPNELGWAMEDEQ